MSTLPVDLGDRDYNHSDFTGKGYVSAFPDFLGDAYKSLLNQVQGVCVTPNKLLPSLRTISLTCSRNRHWTPGMTLLFSGRSTGQLFALKVLSYDTLTGLMSGDITNVSTAPTKRLQSGELRADTVWDVNFSILGALEFSQNTGIVLPITSGGLGAALLTDQMAVKSALGMDFLGNRTLRVEDDFLPLGEHSEVGEGGGSKFEVTGFARATNSDTYMEWSGLRGTLTTAGSIAKISIPAGNNQNFFRTIVNIAHRLCVVLRGTTERNQTKKC